MTAGTGTIGIIAASKAGKAESARESNGDAVRDAVGNAKANNVKISVFQQG